MTKVTQVDVSFCSAEEERTIKAKGKKIEGDERAIHRRLNSALSLLVPFTCVDKPATVAVSLPLNAAVENAMQQYSTPFKIEINLKVARWVVDCANTCCHCSTVATRLEVNHTAKNMYRSREDRRWWW